MNVVLKNKAVLVLALLMLVGAQARSEGAKTQKTAPKEATASEQSIIGPLVKIPGGSFMMGSNEGGDYELPIHEVTVQPFMLMPTEVTQKQWQTVMGKNPSFFKKCGPNCPVESISWESIQTFIKKLNQRTGEQYRLPTEAEWEFAANAGSTTKYSWGDVLDCKKARYGFASDECGRKYGPGPVKLFQPNAFGLYDMHGNVWEWVQDCWNYSYRGAPSDSRAWMDGDCGRRALRGGSWYDGPARLRSAKRYWSISDNRGLNGFRLARDL
jgi:formylglycine-generating enzyme required for sulfatase activity